MVITGVSPEVDGGRFPIQRIVGEHVVVEADIFADGHDVLACLLRYRKEDAEGWVERPMQAVGNDRWWGAFAVSELGRYRYTLQAWVDRFRTWRLGLAKKVEAGQDMGVELLVGAELVEAASHRASGADARRLQRWTRTLRQRSEASARIRLALDEVVARTMDQYPDRRLATSYDKELMVVVDRERARFSAWYEMFPRSTSPQPGCHGTFKDCERRLAYVASMGFDVLYFPPIHPIGRTHRKGRDNSPVAGPDDPGSPWAIGGPEGGHTAIHPKLGTLKDFKRLMAKAREYGLEIALDLAFQCSPDHPYVKAHPDWFARRPDGTVQFAENPPKRYEDTYPLNFDTPDWRGLWKELKRVTEFWIAQGVRIFRVDNPHTKPFAFWEWLIAQIKRKAPEVIFLSEAFTRPHLMQELAKRGLTQSYTYFAWRNTKWELTQYFTALTQTDVREYFRPHLWPNTPDILTESLQWGGRSAGMIRLILAATLGANYGIYGPAFELCEHTPLTPGREDYLHAEKYELRCWDVERPDSLRHLIARVNEIRRQNPALHSDWGLQFHPTDNEQLICYSKATQDRSNVILVVVNLDSQHPQAGWVDLALEPLGLEPDEPYQVHDLLTDARYLWQGAHNYVELRPQPMPAHLFRVRHRIRSEHNFESLRWPH